MHHSVENLTNPGEEIVAGDKYRAYFTADRTSWEDLIYKTSPSEDTIAEIEARLWRDEELTRTDIAATVSDYPNAEAILTYRQELRDWPSTADFLNTKPTLGS